MKEVDDKQLKDYIKIRQDANFHRRKHRMNLSRVSTGPTRSAFCHTGQKNMKTYTLDHILFDNRSLHLHSFYEALEIDAFSSVKGLPNLKCPSDHLPIAACFQPIAPRGLAEITRIRVIQGWKLRESYNKGELQQLISSLEAEEMKLQALVPKPIFVENADGGGSSKKRKRKERRVKPPEFMITFLRAKKKKIKELSHEHMMLRSRLISGLSSEIIDALEQEGILSEAEITDALAFTE